MTTETRQKQTLQRSEAYRLGYAHGLIASQLASPSQSQLEMVYDVAAYKAGFKAGQKVEN